MNCWICDRSAHGVCRFCGRAICKEHAQHMPFILDVFSANGEGYKGLVVPDVLYCGQCKPKDEPVRLDPLNIHVPA